MENTFLHEQNTLPLIRMARLYDTIQDGRTKPTAERVADCFELGLFLSDSGSFTADGREYRIVPGLLRFTRPGQHICSSPPYRCYTVYFTLDGPVCDYLTSLLLDCLICLLCGISICKFFFDLSALCNCGFELFGIC